MRSTMHQVRVCTCFCTRILAFFKADCPLSVPMFFPPRKLHPHCRLECYIANKHSAQCTVQGSYKQLCTISSWHYQIASRTKSWASSFCPLYVHVLVAFFLARAKRAASAPAERSTCTTILIPAMVTPIMVRPTATTLDPSRLVLCQTQSRQAAVWCHDGPTSCWALWSEFVLFTATSCPARCDTAVA